MADLHTLLRQSIIDRGISDPRDREEIYAEARRAIIRRLWEHQPALDQDAIDARIDDFDASVATIEDELFAYFSHDIRGHLPAPKRAPEPEPEPEEPPRRRRATPVRARYADEPAYAAEPEDDLYYPDEPAPEPPRRRAPAYDEAGYETTGYDAPGHDAPGREPRGREIAAYGPDDDYAGYDDGSYDRDGYDEPRYERGHDDARALPAPDDDYVDETYEDTPAPYAAPLGFDAEDEDDAFAGEAYDAPRQADRWTAPPDDRPVRPREPAPTPRKARKKGFSDGAKIAVLVGAIAALLIVLIGVGIFALVSGPAAPDEGVTVTINDRRQVSDAATAARLATEDLPVRQTFRLFDGLDPTVFETAANNPVRFDTDSEGNFARVSSAASAAGARIVIGPGLASRLAGQRVRVRMTVRSSTDRGALSMRFAYQSGIAISHWQTANLDPAYEEVAIVWRVPAQRTSVAGDYVVVEPGIPGDGTGVDIKSAEIDIIAE